MKQVGNTILAKGGNHILAKRDNSAWPKGSKLSGFSNIQIQGKLPHYSHLMYDKYRKVFYRFALMPDDNIKPFSNNPHQSFSIIILNKDYEIIGETKFPGNTYAHHLCFVGKKGLYISENNENNPQFDENKLVFRCFTLQGRKK